MSVIVALPAPSNVMLLPEMAATEGVLDIALQSPKDCEVGNSIFTAGSPTSLEKFGSFANCRFPRIVTLIAIGPTAAKFPNAGWFAVIVMIPGLRAMRLRPLTTAIVGSDDVKDHGAGEVDVGEMNGITFVSPLLRLASKSWNPPTATLGVTPATVTFIEVLTDRKPPAGAWRAVMIALPDLSVSKLNPSRATIVGSELVNVHAPVELERGTVSCTLATLSIERFISLNEPSVGVGASIVRVIVFDEDNQRVVGD